MNRKIILLTVLGVYLSLVPWLVCQPEGQVLLRPPLATRVMTPSGPPLYNIAVSYDATPLLKSGQGADVVPTLSIPTVGPVPLKGEFEYLSETPFIKFKDARTGQSVEMVSVAEKSRLSFIAGGVVFEVVRREKLFEGSRTETWSHTNVLDFKAVANKILVKRFGTLYPAFQEDACDWYTVYHEFPRDDDWIARQVGLRLTFPHEKGEKGFCFKIYSSARERRLHEVEWKYNENVGTRTSQMASGYVDEIVRAFFEEK